jgi:hypothetical protein
MQKKKAIITGDIIKGQASYIWNHLPQFEHLPEPTWSNGWLEGFKKRFRIKEYVQHGEASSADINSPKAIQQIEDLRKLCSQYKDQDIFNMDETGLFWKLSPNRTLETEARSGGKKSKDRVTLALTTNGDGSEKLDPWIRRIGVRIKPFNCGLVEWLRALHRLSQLIYGLELFLIIRVIFSNAITVNLQLLLRP